MNRSLVRVATYVQLFVMTVLATGCTPTQPFFLNESPDLRHYLDTATQIEYPDVHIEGLEEATQSLPPLTLGNHNYKYWDLTLEECVAIALQNAKFFNTVGGTSEQRQNIIAQVLSGTSEQFGSIYDVARQQSTTQTVPLSVDGAGNRPLARGTARANQYGGVEDALAEFDAQVTSFVNYGTTDRPRNVTPGNVFSVPLYTATDATQQTAISKRMATGTVATLRQQFIYGENNLPVIGNGGRVVRSDWTAIIEAQVTQPLMRGRGTMINRIPVVLASLNEDVSIAEFEALVRNLVYDVERAYWDLYTRYRNVESEMVGRNGTQVMARLLATQLEGGKGSLQDLSRAEAQYYDFRGRLEGALAGSNVQGSVPDGVYGAERELRFKMGLEPTDGRLIRPIDEPTIAHVTFDWYDVVAQASVLSPELRRSRIRLKQNELELIAARNQILPELNLTITGRAIGIGDELGGSGGDFPAGGPGTSALDQLTDGDFTEIGARLDLSPTAIGARRELARIRNAQIQVAREKAFIEDQEKAMQYQLSEAIAKLETHYRQIQTYAARLNKAEAEARLRAEVYERTLGQETPNFVLDSQLNRANAQIAYYRALAEYNKSIAYVHMLKGTLLEYNNVSVSEGPWNDKAYWDALERARERSAGYEYQYGVTRPNVVRKPAEISVNPAALAPKGIADKVILGHESVDGEFYYEGAPIGSGVPVEMLPPTEAIEEMPELEIPDGPEDQSPTGIQTVPPMVQPAVGSGVPALNRPASHEAPAGEAPRVSRRPLPTAATAPAAH